VQSGGRCSVQVHEYRGNIDPMHGLPEHVPVYGVKHRFQIHKCDMQWLLELSVDFCQQTQCQDCIQCGTTMGKSGLVRLTMLLKQGVKSGEEDMCKYFAWD